jgi:tellurite resistance protein
MSTHRFPVPASFFGIILCLVGLGNCWQTAAHVWRLPGWVGETIMLIAVFAWALLLLAYIGKWIWARPLALAEFQHPIQCCFIGLVPVSTVLIALAVAPYSHGAGQALFTTGAAGQLIFQLIFGIHRTGTFQLIFGIHRTEPSESTQCSSLFANRSLGDNNTETSCDPARGFLAPSGDLPI